MKIIDLFEAASHKGTYAAVKFSDATKDAIKAYIKDNEIPNGVPRSKLHTTLLYSRKHLPNYKALGKLEDPLIGVPGTFEVWESSSEPKTRCLVLKFKCSELDARHEQLMTEHKATYDFPEYKTHITFSYDIGDMDHTDLPPLGDEFAIEIVHEYQEDLDLNWAKNNTGKK